MADRPRNVLILCTGNSARSILGEALINHLGGGRFAGYSAGSKPRGEVHPVALELLEQLKLPTAGLRSKSWDEFARPGAPAMDFVFTVCDNAAGETCPLWLGAPLRAHWGIEDPAAVQGSRDDQWQAFRKAYDELAARIRAFMALDIGSMDQAALKSRLDEIGRTGR